MFRTDPFLFIHPIGWRLGGPLFWETETHSIAVPEDFITDLASIPQLFQGIIKVNGPHRRAAILHDYLFVIQDRSRAEVDAIFLEAMEKEGVSWITRNIMYSAVRIGGWLAWNKNARALEANPLKFLASHGLTIADCERSGYC